MIIVPPTVDTCLRSMSQKAHRAAVVARPLIASGLG
jgi:hypothetical protein